MTSVFQVLHYLFQVPFFSFRSRWIARVVGVAESSVSLESSDVGIDLIEAARRVLVIVVATHTCGVCGSADGEHILGDGALVYGRNGPREASCFNFSCSSCGSLSGVTTCEVASASSELRHVISVNSLSSEYFLPLRKPHQRRDEYLGFERSLLEEFTNDAACHKTFESFCLRHNRTLEYIAHQRGEPSPRNLEHHTFRQAWFLCAAFDAGLKLNICPENTLIFTKVNMSGHGAFEHYLEQINGPLAQAFTARWVVHGDSCGIAHKCAVGDGHMKTHFECCGNKCGPVLVDETLGSVQLTCANWPAYIGGKKLDYCLPCLREGQVGPGVGVRENGSTEDLLSIKNMNIDQADLCLVGRSWFDRDGESPQEFLLSSVEWVLIDSSDGKRKPTLIGNYTCSSGLSHSPSFWSTMTEIRSWISMNAVAGDLSDREARALRRSVKTAESSAKKVNALEDREEGSLASDVDGYALENIHQRVVMADCSISYQVSYLITNEAKNKKQTRIFVWEPSDQVSRVAIERWKKTQSSFRYSDEDLVLMKQCAGSLKESQERQVTTNAGVFAVILNCGIIVSLFCLHGSESLSQIYVHITEMYARHGKDLPSDFGYDDGCHLRRFAELRKDKNPRARSFWEKVGQFIFVDRFHWINHKKSHVYCTVNCNPNSNSRLDGANTEVCEQSFRWFSRHKYSVNHMSPARFRFFMTLLADRRNEILIEKRGVFQPE